MKKVLIIILLVIVIILGYTYISNNNLMKLLKDVEKEEFYIDKYSIFGTHFNINGCIDKDIKEDLSLVLKNKNKEININSTFNKESGKTCFYLSDKNNSGLNLDELELGEYLLLVKSGTKEEVVYYTLKNNTNYKNLEYYTITKDDNNNKINIDFNKHKEKDYIKFSIKKSKLPNAVYDIVIDPGHGGNDTGASGKLNGTTYYESELTLEISLLLKKRLEDLGLKVKLTRDSDIFMDPYGDEGRAVIVNDYSPKYSLSIHLNSAEGTMSYGGVEVYTPNDIDYGFATTIAHSLSDIVGYSKKPTNKVDKGIYYDYFKKSDIKDSEKEQKDNGLKPYDIVEGAPSMYMIREVGGINTYAYIDGRNDKHGLNKYYNSNKTAEPYLLELGYLNYSNDLEVLVNTPEKFADAISNGIKEYLKIS